MVGGSWGPRGTRASPQELDPNDVRQLSKSGMKKAKVKKGMKGRTVGPTQRPTLAATSRPTLTPCPAESPLNATRYPVNSRHYFYVKKEMSWNEANALVDELLTCGRRKAHLATVTNAESKFVGRLADFRRRIWLGLRTYKANLTEIKWVTGEP